MDKPHYNQEQIAKAVQQLSETRRLIGTELNPEKYSGVLERIEKTIESLNNADDISPFQRQISEQIIDPVSRKIQKSSSISLLVSLVFGFVGLVSFGLSVLTATPALTASPAVIEKSSRTDPSAQSSVLNSEAYIYPEDVSLSKSILAKFVECHHLQEALLYQQTSNRLANSQQSLVRSLQPMRYTVQHITEHIIAETSPRPTRKPPRQIRVRPYNLEATAVILLREFSSEQIDKVWGDCSCVGACTSAN